MYVFFLAASQILDLFPASCVQNREIFIVIEVPYITLFCNGLCCDIYLIVSPCRNEVRLIVKTPT